MKETYFVKNLDTGLYLNDPSVGFIRKLWVTDIRDAVQFSSRKKALEFLQGLCYYENATLKIEALILVERNM